ncbi:MAG: AAA family ATPase, partial [Polyangiales bacterium]
MATPDPPRPLPIGQSDFGNLRRAGFRYVDKTRFAMQVLDGATVQLYTRPRRFGKTLNLSMLRHFVEKCDEAREELFEGLEIWDERHGERYSRHFQRYPVIDLSFRTVKSKSWHDAQAAIRALLREELRRLQAAGYCQDLNASEQLELDTWLDPKAPIVEFQPMLRLLSKWLERESQAPVIILVDEYDTPLHAAYRHEYYDEAIEFFRGLLTGGLKDNKSLYRGVLTGILRVAKEGLFSGLNNVGVFSITDEHASSSFGFTGEDVRMLAQERGRVADLPGLEAWYNGYCFGAVSTESHGATPGHIIYNPWSILSYLNAPEDGFRPYWINTSDNALLQDLITGKEHRLGAELTALMQGECIDKPLQEYLVLRSLDWDQDGIWNFLFMAGYLRLEGAYDPQREMQRFTVPNQEVATIYRHSFLQWLRSGLKRSSQGALELCEAIVRGDAEYAEEGLQELFFNVLSYNDLQRRHA